jgi:hypothetical protein
MKAELEVGENAMDLVPQGTFPLSQDVIPPNDNCRDFANHPN